MAVGCDVFERVLCGVDESDAGADAAWIAAWVAAPEGPLVLVTVEDPSVAVHTGWMATRVAEQLVEEAKLASARGEAEAVPLHRAEMWLLEGNPLDRIQQEIERTRATLAVVGTHGHSRAVGITLGSVTTHPARCSVLVVREPGE